MQRDCSMRMTSHLHCVIKMMLHAVGDSGDQQGPQDDGDNGDDDGAGPSTHLALNEEDEALFDGGLWLCGSSMHHATVMCGSLDHHIELDRHIDSVLQKEQRASSTVKCVFGYSTPDPFLLCANMPTHRCR
jgi:hypothetical protein